ncbi:hypothetical protein [Streptomyces sp. NPDC048581]|uniref:hypothetical protein n=1 Tax=unclassified Streptomyces TaxID=2593676 RepID=UPI0037185E3B
MATAANMGGLGCGPLLAGVLAQYAAWPLYLPFAGRRGVRGRSMGRRFVVIVE